MSDGLLTKEWHLTGRAGKRTALVLAAIVASLILFVAVSMIRSGSVSGAAPSCAAWASDAAVQRANRMFASFGTSLTGIEIDRLARQWEGYCNQHGVAQARAEYGG